MNLRHKTTLLVLLLIAVSVAACGARPPKATPTPFRPADALHPWPELEARLPDEIGGITLVKASLVVDPRRQSEKTLEVLRILGRSTQDMQIASADADGLDFLVFAQRIVGSTGGDAAVAFKTVDEGDPAASLSYAPEIIAGKHVLTRTAAGDVAYIYSLEDIMFIVSGNRGHVEEALSKLN